MARVADNLERIDSRVHVQVELHADMARAEAQALVEAMRIFALRIRGQLNHRAPSPTSLQNRPFEKCPAESLASPSGHHSYSFDLGSFGPDMRQVRKKRQLKGPDDLVVDFSNDQAMTRIGVDRPKRREIGLREGLRKILPRSAQFVVGVEAHDRRQIADFRIAECQVTHVR